MAPWMSFAGRMSLVLICAGTLLAACERAAPSAAGRMVDAGQAPVVGASEEMPADLGPAAGPERAKAFAGEFEAVGSEPFWRLTLLTDWASFERPGLPLVGGLPGERMVREKGLFQVAGPVAVVLREQECQHASGETYPLQATVTFEGIAYEGCARRADASAATRASWSDVIGELLTPIDACLARTPSKPARVTVAYASEGGQTNVRLIDGEGGRFECTVTEAGAISYYDAIGERDLLPGERDPLFTRDPDPPPEGRCLESEAVTNADGAPLGHLTRRTC